MTLGQIKTVLLDGTAQLLNQLQASNSAWLNKWLYVLLRTPFEVITGTKVLRVQSSVDYALSHQVIISTVATQREGFYANAVWYDDKDEQRLTATSMPDISLYCFHDVIVLYGSDFIVDAKDRIAIDDALAVVFNDDNHRYCDSVTKAQQGKIAIVRWGRLESRLERAVKLNGKYPFNYYHGVYETLVKLLVLKECNKQVPPDSSFIFDEDIMKIASLNRIKEILCNNMPQSVTTVSRGDRCRVDNLYALSPVNLLAQNHVDYLKAHDWEYVFDKHYTVALREALLPFRSEDTFPKRFFISRKGMSHRNFNEDDLFEVLRPYGFERVYPQDLTLEQQMKMFSDAEWIFGASGAALTNLLFCSKGCRIVCITRYTSYMVPVFIPPVCFNEANIVFFRSAKGISVNRTHSDFIIDVDEFRLYVKSLFEPNHCD